MTEPGTFAMIPALHGEQPLVELLDELAQQERDAFVDEGGLGALFVRAEDCERKLTDRRFGAVAMTLLAFSGVTECPLHDLWATLMFGKDGDEHRRIRAAAAGFFTRGGASVTAPVSPRMRARSRPLSPRVPSISGMGWRCR